MKIKKNLQHGYLFLFIVIGTIFFVSLGFEIYLTKAKSPPNSNEQINEKKDDTKELEIVIETPEKTEPTFDDFITLKGYVNKKSELLINNKKIETYKVLGNREYFDFESALVYGTNKFEIKAVDEDKQESIKVIEIERLRNDFEVANNLINCSVNGETLKFGEVIYFKCNGKGFDEETKVSVSICWNDKPEIIELRKDGDLFVGDAVVREREKGEVKTFINIVNKKLTAKTNFIFKVNT